MLSTTRAESFGVAACTTAPCGQTSASTMSSGRFVRTADRLRGGGRQTGAMRVMRAATAARRVQMGANDPCQQF